MKSDPRVSAYIAKAAPFARPILKHLRALVQRTCPDAREEIKWHTPMFSVQGKLFCGMAAFREHCRFLVFGPEARALIRKSGYGAEEEGSLGKIRSLSDLPPDRELAKYLKFAAAQVAEGKSLMSRARREPRPPPRVPADFAAALKRNRAAAAAFAGLSPSCRREYLEWILGAKREETRTRRREQAIAWISEGKNLRWRYGG